jgi:malonate-semialdehyde dehydrogenase (acetylating)/methylmalonate-semialdehyde dehydrogenase
VSTTALESINHCIGGRETAGASTRTAPVYDPATGAEQRRVLLAEPADVDAAVQAAKAASAARA